MFDFQSPLHDMGIIYLIKLEENILPCYTNMKQQQYKLRQMNVKQW